MASSLVDWITLGGSDERASTSEALTDLSVYGQTNKMADL
jgi:hypothetical protein